MLSLTHLAYCVAGARCHLRYFVLRLSGFFLRYSPLLFSAQYPTAFQTEFGQDMSALLNISSDQIVMTALEPGATANNVMIAFELRALPDSEYPNATASGNDTAAPDAPNPDLLSVRAHFARANFLGSISSARLEADTAQHHAGLLSSAIKIRLSATRPSTAAEVELRSLVQKLKTAIADTSSDLYLGQVMKKTRRVEYRSSDCLSCPSALSNWCCL